MLNPNEKIDSWDIIVKTVDNTAGFTESRELSFMANLRLEIPDSVSRIIDDILEANYPVTWLDDNHPAECVDIDCVECQLTKEQKDKRDCPFI